jgi:uncharacterized protein YyaL (SSP411 family)
MSHYIIEEKSSEFGFLTDNSYMLQCLIDCYQVTSEKKFLDFAQKLAQFMINKLWDTTGGFYDKPENKKAFGALKKSDKPLEENCITVQAFLRLHHLTGKNIYFEKAKKTLEYFVSDVKKYGIMASSYGLAVEQYLRSVQVQVIGNIKDSATLKLRDQSLKTYNPLKTVETIDIKVDEQRLKALGYPVPKKATAYICSEGKCTSTTNPNEIVEKMGVQL